VVDTESGWGFHERAEMLNGRMAMLGFIACWPRNSLWVAKLSLVVCSALADYLMW